MKTALIGILYSLLILIGSTFLQATHSAAQEASLPLPAGLEPAVRFWKQVFTRYSVEQVVFVDPLDLATIYSVITVPDNDQGRALIQRERLRIMAEYDLTEEDGRVLAQRGAKERFLSGLRLSGKYLPQMRKIFREEGAPVDLVYLPLVESSFNVHARSSVGALGMWQFMAHTGKKFLRVGDVVDERKDPFAATRAAARLLNENHRILGNWPLAVTAYNHGTEGILRGISAVGSKHLPDLIRQYKSPTFGYASKNFYAELLAAIDVAKNGGAHFPGLRLHAPVTFQEVDNPREISLSSVLKPARISPSQFFEWNPALNPAVGIIPAGYRIKLPPAKVSQFTSAQRRVADASLKRQRAALKPGEPGSRRVHRVVPGETLSKIANRYGISIRALRQANGLSDDQALATGRHLKIPQS